MKRRHIAIAAASLLSISASAADSAGRPFKAYASWEIPLGTSSGVVDYSFDEKSVVAIIDADIGADTLRWGFQRIDAKGEIISGGALALPSGAGEPSIMGVAGDVILIRCAAPWSDGGTGTLLATFSIKSVRKTDAHPVAPKLGELLLPPAATVRYDAAIYKDCVEIATRSWDTAAGTTTCGTIIYDIKLAKTLRRLDVSGSDAWTAVLPESSAPKIRASRILYISEDWESAKATINLYK